jgi:membrane-associated phospholipid phosphatase
MNIENTEIENIVGVQEYDSRGYKKFYLNSLKLMTKNFTLRFLAELFASYSIFVFVFFGWYIAKTVGGFQIDLLALAAFVLARFVFVTLINYFYKRRRPYQQFKFAPIHNWLFTYPEAGANSFPSRHTSSMVAISTVLIFYFPVIGLVCLTLAVLAGFARVAMGYHYPSDIAGGIIVGLLSAFIVLTFAPFIINFIK